MTLSNDKEYQQVVTEMREIRNRLNDIIAKSNTEVTEETTTTKHPDAKRHLQVSVVKSIVRMFAGGLLCTGELFWAGSLLILAEGLGVIEELV